MSDVRLAAERLRQVENADQIPAVYKDFKFPHEKYMLDRLETSLAYLAEHPADDGDVITEEWLDRELVKRPDECTFKRWTYHATNGGVAVMKIDDRFCIEVWSLLYGNAEIRSEKATVGQLLMLCNALGIPLKPGATT